MDKNLYFAIGIDNDDFACDQCFVAAARSKDELNEIVKNNYVADEVYIFDTEEATYIATQILKTLARYANLDK